jgi:lipoprotein-anchoring transpeptidase ErfK/SrfK
MIKKYLFILFLFFLFTTNSILGADSEKRAYDPDIHNSIQKLKQKFDLKDNDYAIIISPEKQELYLVKDYKIQKVYLVSTSKYGLGTRLNSNKTPYGTHRVIAKIGQDAPFGTIFNSRVNTGRIASINSETFQKTQKDYVTTRILWLDGQEKGVNKGGLNDSYGRCIYIHGTPEEKWIGYPTSKGCIRMNNKDVVELFELVGTGVLVEIIPKS